jgi:hypothetical protein
MGLISVIASDLLNLGDRVVSALYRHVIIVFRVATAITWVNPLVILYPCPNAISWDVAIDCWLLYSIRSKAESRKRARKCFCMHAVHSTA